MSAPLGQRDVAAATALGLAGVGIPLWLLATAGAIGIPSNDDWVYMRGADSLYRTGVLSMPGHTAASIGQLYLVQPLLWLSGGDRWAYTAFGLGMALVGLVATYLLARRFLGTGASVTAVLVLIVFPGFGREAATFMTDVPTFALIMLSLLLGTLWLQDGRRSALVLSLGVGLLGLSIREFALAAPLAVLVAGWVRRRPGDAVWLTAVSGLFIVGVVGVLAAAASFAGRGDLASPDLYRLAFMGPVITTMAAVLLPALAPGVGRRMATLTPQQLIFGASAVALIFVLPLPPLVGQLWSADGLAGNALLHGTREPVIGGLAWSLSEQLALLAGALLAALIARWIQRNAAGIRTIGAGVRRGLGLLRRREAVLLLFLAAYAGELAFLVSLAGYPLDRYLYPMVPVLAILLLRRAEDVFRIGRRQAFGHAALAWLSASAFVIVANAAAYDAARWRAGESAVALGYDPRLVDAGYEWVGYHATGTGNDPRADYGLTWYDDLLASSRPCAVVSNSPMDDETLVLIQFDPSAYRRDLLFGPEQPLYLYGSLADVCPPAPRNGASSSFPTGERGNVAYLRTGTVVHNVNALRQLEVR